MKDSTTNPLDLSDCRYLITGAASGIGQATARLASSLGAKVICLDQNEPGLETTMGLLEGKDHGAECHDLADTAAIPALIQHPADRWIEMISRTQGERASLRAARVLRRKLLF